MSDLISVLYMCGHKSDTHKRRSTGVSDPCPLVCECEGCWEEDIKDLSSLLFWQGMKEDPRPLWCPQCQAGEPKECLVNVQP